MQAVSAEIGAGRTGVRLSPMTTFSGTPRDSDPQALFSYVIDRLSPLGLAYVHMIEGETGGAREPTDANVAFDYDALKRRFRGAWMVNNGYTRALALDAVASGRADLVAFGRPFMSNPDLVRRLKEDLPLADVRWEKAYGGGLEGYADYPNYA
jgi:N-ethylmaleimide reductase